MIELAADFPREPLRLERFAVKVQTARPAAPLLLAPVWCVGLAEPVTTKVWERHQPVLAGAAMGVPHSGQTSEASL